MSRPLSTVMLIVSKIRANMSRLRATSIPVLPVHAPRLRARDVYCYFDNDMKVQAPFDAQRLVKALGDSPA